MNIPTRLIAALALIGVLRLCYAGFMGTFEYAEPLRRLPWQASYGLIAFVCLVSLAFQLEPAMIRMLGMTRHNQRKMANRHGQS